MTWFKKISYNSEFPGQEVLSVDENRSIMRFLGLLSELWTNREIRQQRIGGIPKLPSLLKRFKLENITLLVSQGCCNIVSQFEWLKITEIYYLIVLEAGSLKSSCQPGHTTSESLWESFLTSSHFWCLLIVFGVSLLIDALLQSLSPLSHDPLSLRVFLFLLRLRVMVESGPS